MDLAIEGTFSGNLKQLTFEIYLANGPVASVGEGTANANLLIDGEVVHTATQTAFTPQAAGDIKKIVFSYTKLDKYFADQPGDVGAEEDPGSEARQESFDPSAAGHARVRRSGGAPPGVRR